MSHPHGCVSWNPDGEFDRVADYSHTLTGVWVEMPITTTTVSPYFLSHPHGCVSWNLLKQEENWLVPISHTLTGVWVEMRWYQSWKRLPCHTLTGVWVEIPLKSSTRTPLTCHTLTGVWVEISYINALEDKISHTLTGVWVEICRQPYQWQCKTSHPHGCVSWNVSIVCSHGRNQAGHTLTGVWVEMVRASSTALSSFGHTLTGMYWKLWRFPDSWFTSITPKIQI